MKNLTDDSAESEVAARLDVERELWQTQKIDALGRLAGGIAHDFNNFLAVVLLHVDMMNLQLEPKSPHRHRISEIKEVSDNAAATVRQLMAFGRKLPMISAPLKLNNLVETFAENARLQIGKRIEIELNLETNLGVCFVDPNHILQILQNLAAHAEDQMPNGGKLIIETSNIVLDKNAAHEPQTGGAYVEIIVSDDGGEIDAETLEHIFEPFFPVGETRKGSGLRLASVYGIVKQLNGFIWAESKMPRGASFKIQFPRIDESVTVKAQPKKVEQTAAQTENATVLLVDDERAVRFITGEFLKLSGYEVFEASNGMEALEFAQSYNKPIHLLLTDLSMPLMSGREVAEKIVTLHPEIVVLFMSGSVADAIEETSDGNTNHFIGKPFSSDSLIAKISEILEK